MRGVPRLVWITAAVTVLVAAVFAFDLTPWVRGGYGWRWEYDPLPLVRWIPTALLMTIYVAGSASLLRRDASLRAILAWSGAFAVILALAVTAAHEGDAVYALFARTVSRLATGPHWLSAQVDWADGEWRAWTDVMRGAGGHLSNLPPGLPMLYAALTGLFGLSPGAAQTVAGALLPYQCHNFELIAYPPQAVASAGFGVLMPVWAALAVFPMAAVARRLSGERAARWAVLWWPLTPALMAFAGSFNTAFPLLTLTVLWALSRALDADSDGSRLLWAALSGLLTGLATFANFAFAPLPLILGLFTLFYGLAVVRRGFGALLGLGVAFAVGLALPWLLFALATGLTPLDILRASFEFHLDLDRPYAFWAVMHVWDWLVWGGLGLSMFATVNAVRVRRTLDGGAALSAALLVGMAVLTLSGTARGETGRVWLAFTPLLTVAAADGLRRLTNESTAPWGILAASHGLVALVLALSLPVVGIDLTPPPALDTMPARNPTDAQFIDSDGSPLLRLTAWDVLEDDDGGFDYAFTFDVQRRADQPYYLGAVTVPVEGETIETGPQQPRTGSGDVYPATCFAPGQTVTVRIHQTASEGFEVQGAYISLGMFGAAEGAGPLRVITPGGEDTQIGLGPVDLADR